MPKGWVYDVVCMFSGQLPLLGQIFGKKSFASMRKEADNFRRLQLDMARAQPIADSGVL